MFEAGQATSPCQEKGKASQNIIQMSSTKLAFVLHTLITVFKIQACGEAMVRCFLGVV